MVFVLRTKCFLLYRIDSRRSNFSDELITDRRQLFVLLRLLLDAAFQARRLHLGLLQHRSQSRDLSVLKF